MNKKEINEIDLKNEITEEIYGYLNQGILLQNSVGLVTKKYDTNLLKSIFSAKIKILLYGLFQYENLPEEIPKYIIENYLWEQKDCLFFKSGGKYYIGNYSAFGDYNEYMLPITVYPILKNGNTLSKRTIDKDCIIIDNLPIELSTMQLIEPFLNRMILAYQCSNDTLKMSIIKWLMIANTDKSIKNLKGELQRLIDGSGSIAIVYDNFGKIEKMPFYEEFDGKNYWEEFQRSYNFILEILGIDNNPNPDKRERLITSELSVNEQSTSLTLQAMYNSRLNAINKINKMFGLDIKLKKIEKGEIEEYDNSEEIDN